MNSKKIKVLLVEDNEDTFKGLKLFLENEGYSVLMLHGHDTIGNYDDAVEVCREQIPHVAVLDIVMPGNKDGIDIAAYILKKYYSPVIFLSDYYNSQNRKRLADLKMDDFIHKMPAAYEYMQLKIKLELLQPKIEYADRIRTEMKELNVQPVENKKAGEYTRMGISWQLLRWAETTSSERNYVILNMHDGKAYRCKMSLKEIRNLMPASGFVQISPSKILNTKFITGKGVSTGKGENKRCWIYHTGKEKHTVTDFYRNDLTHAALNNRVL